NAPDLGDVSAMLWVRDVARAGQLVALLSVFAPALAVALSGDGGVAAVLATYAPRSQHDVDCAEHVLHAVRMMLDAARVQQERSLGRAPQLRGLANGALADTCDFGGLARRPLPHMLGHGVEADRPVVDEVVIEPVVLNHQMEYAVE